MNIIHFFDTHLGFAKRAITFVFTQFKRLDISLVPITGDYATSCTTESFYIIGELYRQVFLISCESEIEGIFERVVEL